MLQRTPCKKVGAQSMQWEMVFANRVSDKRPASRLYEKLLQLNNQKTKIRFRNGWGGAEKAEDELKFIEEDE